MSNYPPIPEPEVDPLADTNPSLVMRPVVLQANPPVSGWRRATGLISLLAAAGFTLATIVVLMSPQNSDVQPTPPTQVANVESLPATPTPAELPPQPTTDTTQMTQPNLAPTLSSEVKASLLSAPLVSLDSASGSLRLVSNLLRPFTTIPDRPRGEVITYEAQRGDTISSIAQRFGLTSETIAWSNNRRYVQVLYPGDVVNILPLDGVLHTAIANLTISEIGAKYGVDAFTIIDSEYNQLAGVTPDYIPMSGTKIVVPGGVGEQISWQVAVEVEEGTGYVRAFAPGMAGSCGQVTAAGGEYWTTPLPNGYTFTQGFSAFHSGVDLSANTGTPVHAANGGPVLFSGWNSWGYGYTVVLGHGPYSTLYGHLSDTAVGCGQYVSANQIVGYVGSTGNSSGPHLHFEIRYQDTPTDPAAVIGF